MHKMTSARRLGGWITVTTLGIALTLAAVLTSNTPTHANSDSTSDICDRTQKVQDAILAKRYDVDACGDVTDSHLAGITGDLTLSENNISALRTGDFRGAYRPGIALSQQ